MNYTEEETSPEYTGMYAGRLGDFGLGNEHGIPSAHANSSNQELEAIAHKESKELQEVADPLVYGCIDGRHCTHNADGSAPEIRYRRVGGSASNFGVAMNSGARIVGEIDEGASLGEQIMSVDKFMEERSGHLGGCGGANGEIDDNQAIHKNDRIMQVTKSIMNLEAVASYLGVSFRQEAANIVRRNAGKTADYLQLNNWDGQKYVEGVVKTNPANVEVLEVDENDHTYHGHKESKIVIILGSKTSTKDDEFVWNLHATKAAAEKLAQGDFVIYQRAVIADIAKHLSVCNRLPSDKTPIMIYSA